MGILIGRQRPLLGCFLLLLLLEPGCHARHKHFHSRVPIVDLNGAEELIGTVREDQPGVTVSPQLRILHGTGPICRYELSWADDTKANAGNNESMIPFEAHILDSTDGIAQIRHRKQAPPLDCAHQAAYRFRLAAVKCGDALARSEPVELRISVQDVNNHAPEFDAPWYSFDVDEGHAAPMEIARLLATDKDCGHPYGKVCRYELTNILPNNPFHIDDRGVLSVLRPLNRSQAQSHILTVVAEDCGMLRSNSVLVTVNVRPRCVDTIHAVAIASTPKHIAQGDAPASLLPDVEVRACAGGNRQSSVDECETEAQVELETDAALKRAHLVGSGLLEQCGIAAGGVELIPAPEGSYSVEVPMLKGKNNNKKRNGTNVAMTMTRNDVSSSEDGGDDGDDEDGGVQREGNNGGGELIDSSAEEEEEEEAEDRKREKEDKQWAFDGKRAIQITPEKMPKVVPERFSLMFSMRAEPGATEQQQRQKQNILCETDTHGLNRHHFAVYVRHCKLELLLRREPTDASAEFRAAEWRWNDPRVCDGQWHRYGLQFADLDNVQLTVDGQLFNTSQRNPEILDDWPLHNVKDKKTRLVVGACWHGRQRELVQFFRGHLAAMWLWPGRVQTVRQVHCAHGMHERLQLAEHLEIQRGASAKFSRDHTSVHLHANTPAEMTHLLRGIQLTVDPLFAKSDHTIRLAPAVGEGQRRLQVMGSLKCANNATRPLAPMQTTIEVNRAQQHSLLSVTGRHIVMADRQNLKIGAALLPDVQIMVTEGSMDATGAYKLDSCWVHMRPARDMDLELFSSPTLLLEKLNLQFVHDKQGFSLKGPESAQAYADVLAHIHYFNLRPESFPHRSYTLQCSMLDGKLLSNELFTTMNIDATPSSTGNGVNDELDEAVQKLVQISDKLDNDMLPLVQQQQQQKPSSAAVKQQQHHKQQRDEPMVHHLEMPSFDQLGSNRLQNILEMNLPRPKALLGHHGYEVGQGAVAGGAVAVVVVICVGFLLVLLVIGVLKMRDQPLGIKRRRSSRRDSMLEWDDNGLMNITVNPLEEVGGGGKGIADALDYSEAEDDEEEDEDEEESGSEDGGEGYREVDASEDEAGDDAHHVLPLVPGTGGGGKNGVGLEWDDDSTLVDDNERQRHQ